MATHGVDKSGASDALPEALLTPTDVSSLLGVPVKTLYAWRYKETGPRAILVGRHLRWHPEVVRRWLAERAES
jgi:predicted DNA-binding transcriptional regulator AlpA